MKDRPKVIGVTTVDEHGQVTEWRSGDFVIVNHPGHEDHCKAGEIVTFQILGCKVPDSDDSGIILAAVHLGKHATLTMLPFEYMLKPREPKELVTVTSDEDDDMDDEIRF